MLVRCVVKLFKDSRLLRLVRDKRAQRKNISTSSAMAAQSHIPLIEPASSADLLQISDDLKLGITEDQSKDYLAWLNRALKACDRMREIDEETIPVLYPRIPGTFPSKKDNPYNAWATKMELKGNDSGLLAGKKLAIKDNIFIAGTPLQNGSKVWEGYTPEFDATVVTRILQAGGTINGKSTCENQCYSGNSFTSASGPVSNPHDITRSVGGSSSGSAALVVSGIVDMALGGDQGGSIRGPGSWSGCVGLKPTFGLVPVTGALGFDPTLDHLGPMASNVTDVATLLEVIAGYDDGRDHRQRPDLVIPKYSQMLKGELRGVKIGCLKEGFPDSTSPGVKSVVDDVIIKLREAGAVVEEVSIPIHRTGSVLWSVLTTANYEAMIRNQCQAPGSTGYYHRTASQHMRRALQSDGRGLQPIIKAVCLYGEYVRKHKGNDMVAMAMNRRPTMRKAYDEVLNAFDVVIMPTIPFVAIKLPEPNLSVTEFFEEAMCMGSNLGQFNLTGHPALSLNAGWALPEDAGSGAKALPVGLQVVCKHYEEAKLLDIAYGIEKLLCL